MHTQTCASGCVFYCVPIAPSSVYICTVALPPHILLLQVQVSTLLSVSADEVFV